jgi:hypothetical protein
MQNGNLLLLAGLLSISQSLAGLRDAPNRNLEETIPESRSLPKAFKPERLRMKKLLPCGFGDAPTAGREALPQQPVGPGCSWVIDGSVSLSISRRAVVKIKAMALMSVTITGCIERWNDGRRQLASEPLRQTEGQIFYGFQALLHAQPTRVI